MRTADEPQAGRSPLAAQSQSQSHSELRTSPILASNTNTNTNTDSNSNSNSNIDMDITIALTLLLISITTIIAVYLWRPKKHRFRKRDKVIFYSRRMLHRFNRIKRKNLLKFTKREFPQPLKVQLAKAQPGKAFSRVAVLSSSEEVPLNLFCRELTHALTAIRPVLHLHSENQNQLIEEELENKVLLYQCDQTLTPWTQRCLEQADCLLILAMADMKPSVGIIEQHLDQLSVSAQKELVLLHKQETKKPKDTTKWLNIRSWCSSHHHVRCPTRIFVRKQAKVSEIYSELARTNPPNDNDFARLARFLMGKSIGLVLGGGGARGAAHLGMIKAMREAGIPIDMIGGVSIGAFMGALWAQETDLTRVTQLARDWSFHMTSLRYQILDLTYPATAMFTGAAFNRTIHDVFGDRQIEDLWLPYFTVTTDITDSAPRVHQHGSLWRYVRSSMSLSGYLPPLCDPVDGHLLLDGGYVNNLPADFMHDVMGAHTILAVDVGSQDETDLTNYGDTLNGWWLLWNKWNPFGKTIRVPTLPEIQSRLAYVSCVRQLEEVKRSDYCTYIRPPIDRFKTMQFGSFDEILEVGYKHGSSLFTKELAQSIVNF